MRFSKDNQPTHRRKPTGKAKVTFTVRVEGSTRTYFRNGEKGEAGKVLDKYAKENEIR